jgi:hypothetical protein
VRKVQTDCAIVSLGRRNACPVLWRLLAVQLVGPRSRDEAMLDSAAWARPRL